MPEYGLLIEGHVVVRGDVMDDIAGKTKYTVIEVDPDYIIIEWEDTYTGGTKQATIPPSSWGSVIVMDLKEAEVNDPNLMFKLRRKP